jgi:hypothetical protein
VRKQIVEGVWFQTYETKCKSPQGGIVKKEALFKYSISLIDPKTKATRTGVRVEGDKKVRFSKKSNQVLVMAYIPRLKEEYKNRVISALKEEYGYTNVMQVPKLEKSF